MNPCVDLRRRRWLGQAIALALSGAVPHTRATVADHFPSRPITLWVPWAAGGATDISLRLLADLATPLLGEKVIVENRGGAGGMLAMPVLQQAKPDGYTIAQLPQPIFRAYFTQRVSWHPIHDVTHIIQISGVTFGLLVHAHSRFDSLDDLFEYARYHPGELTIATNGVGTSPHVVLEDLFTARGLRYIHVPYKGVSEQINAIMAGHVMAGVSSTGFGPAVDSGRLRLLVSFAAQRSKRWPKVPTLRDLGYDIVAQSPYGLGGPRGMPHEVVDVLHDAFKKAMFDPLFVQELDKYDQEPDYLGPQAYEHASRELFEKERAAVERMQLSR
jgi:tripartite-type tricarboxylate transporter receptor subunit TctC